MKSIKRLLGRPDRDDFARIVIDALRQNGTSDPIEYDSRNFKLVVGGEPHQIHMYLTNAYEEYSNAARRERAGIVKHYAAGWMAMGADQPSAEDALPTLLPVVRTRSYHDLFRLRSSAEGTGAKDVPIQPLASHLAVSLACDLPDTIRYVVCDDLSRWDLSFETALDRARDNLWERSGGKFESPVAGFYLSPWGDSYDTSRLFLHDLIWHLDVAGDHVAAVPDRGTLIVSGSEDYAGLAMMAKICEKTQDLPRPVSSIPVILQGKQWCTYSPEQGHPEYESFKNLRIIEQGRDYAEQKSLLEAWCEKTGNDLFVAGYIATRNNKTGAYNSYCAWTEGIPTLLPFAEEVAFAAGDNLLGRAPWDHVRQVVAHLMIPTDMYPERFRVEDFPSRDQLAAIGLHD